MALSWPTVRKRAGNVTGNLQGWGQAVSTTTAKGIRVPFIVSSFGAADRILRRDVRFTQGNGLGAREVRRTAVYPKGGETHSAVALDGGYAVFHR